MMRAGIVLSVALLAAEARAEDPCSPSRALIVLDKSSSMVTGSIDGVAKWDIAVAALEDVVSAQESSIELGLMLFPSSGECSPGQVEVAPALNNRAHIMAALDERPPDAGNWTPMAQSLDEAAASPALADATQRRFVILVSDGWQWCSPYDPDTRLTPVGAVRRLREMGVSTYVVGFGDSVDPIALNLMAIEAGTQLAGCDPSGDTPTAPNPCYYRADDALELLGSLDTIARVVAACPPPGDGGDGGGGGGGGGDDTGGTTCTPGATRACGEDVGICRGGTQACGDGGWGACVGVIGPEPEACNGQDDDCDGQIDEGCSGNDDPNDSANTAAGCACRTGRQQPLPGGLLAAGLLYILLRRRRG